MNSIEDLNTSSTTAFEFTDNRPANVRFVTDIFTNFTQTRNEGEEFALPLGFEIKEIVNYQAASAYLEIDLTGAVGSNINWGSLPVHIVSSTPVADVFRLSGFKSRADWDVIKNNIVVELSNSFNGSLTIPVTMYWTSNTGNQNKGYTISLTVNEVLSLTQITDIHYYTHNTAQVIANPPQLVDTGSYTWTVNVEGQRSQVIDEIAYTGSDASFSWDSNLKIATFIGTLSGVNTALAAMTLKVTQNTFWDFDLEYTSSNDNNSETDVSVISCKTTDQSVMKLSIDDTYASPTVQIEDITGGPRITATDGYFLTTIEAYDSNDIQSLYAADTTITGTILSSEADVHYPGWYVNATSPFDDIPSEDLVRTFSTQTAGGAALTIPCYYSTVASNPLRQQNYISNDNSIYTSNNGIVVGVYELGESGYEGVSILQHYNEVYTNRNYGSLTGVCMSGDGSTIVASYAEKDSNQNLVDERIFVYEEVASVWTKTHEIQNPHQVVGQPDGSWNNIEGLVVSENGNYIIGSTFDKKHFVLEFSGGSWSSRVTNLTVGADYADYNKSSNAPAISSDGSRVFLRTGLRTNWSVSNVYADNAYMWIGVWNGSSYAQEAKINVNADELTPVNYHFSDVDITPDGSRFVAQRSSAAAVADIEIYKRSGSAWSKATDFDYYNSTGPRISPDGTTVITMYTSNQGGSNAKWEWDTTTSDWLPQQYIFVHKNSGQVDGSGREIWTSTTVIENDILPPDSATTGRDYTVVDQVHDINNQVMLQGFSNTGFTNGTTPELDGFYKIYSWDELGRTVDNVGKEITIYDTHTSHNALLWNFQLLPTVNLTTPIELVYTTTQYPSGGGSVVSSRNHFIRPV